MTYKSMQVIILPEIYGRTSFITAFETQFLGLGIAVQTLDPFGGTQPVFDDEQHAYDHFMDVCGHDGYLDLLQGMLQETERRVFLLGFSVGASTAWRVLEDARLTDRVQRFVGFYPGQIRHYLSVNPKCPTALVFPKNEAHFSVQDVMRVVGEKDTVTCYQSDAGHGFLNPCSVNFTSGLSAEFLAAFKSVHEENKDKNIDTCGESIDNRVDSYLLKYFQKSSRK